MTQHRQTALHTGTVHDDTLSRSRHVQSAERTVRLDPGLSATVQRHDDAGDGVPSPGRRSSGCLFESVVGGEKVGRYSFLAAGPYLELLASGQRVTEIRGDTTWMCTAVDPLDLLRSRLREVRAAHLPELPPFAGGAVGYAGYDVVRYVEHLPNAPEDDRQLPDMAFGLYDRMVVFDHVKKTMFVIATAQVQRHHGDAAAAYAEAQQRVDAMVERLTTSRPELDCRDVSIVTDGGTGDRLPGELRSGGICGGGAEVCRVHPRRRHLPGRHQPAAAADDPLRSVRDLSDVADCQSESVHVLPAHARRDLGGKLARDHVPGRGREGHRAAAGRHAATRRERRGRPAAGRGAAGRSRRSAPST